MSLKEVGIIGRIPGYNENIDTNNEFAHELLKGVTFIDLKPASYKLLDVLGADGGFNTAMGGDLGKLLKSSSIFKTDTTKLPEVFAGILNRMQKDFNLSNDFAGKNTLRIIAANDSTFTESFSNDFGDENSIISGVKSIASKLGNMPGKTGTIKNKMNSAISGVKTLTGIAGKGVQGLSYADNIALAGMMAKKLDGASGSAGLADLMAGAFFGMNLAAPKQWRSSQYSSQLTLFVKLVAPVGSPECVKRNIVEPIMYLLAASSPLTYAGSMYGFPLLWNVQAHGITNFKVGAITSMAIMRGSFETTFNHLLQPTIVDVRLTITPLISDFAVQTDTGAPSAYKDEVALGATNPGDLHRGMTNSSGLQIKEDILTIKL